VWDFGNTLVENAPGSYTAGDRGRGGWQFSGAQNYTLSGIAFRHARTASLNSAGIRYYNGTTNLYLKNCVFSLNDNGPTGGTENSQATVEFCEFNANGNTNASSPTHNLYIYGGVLAVRYCYIHDSVQAEDFHIRCQSSTLEYNWFARAKNYEGDLMVDDDFSGSGPFTQSMIVRGNVFVQNSLPGNHSQVLVLYNDTGLPHLTMSMRVLFNTFIGVNTDAAFVHLSNADGTPMTAEISDNLVYGTQTPVLIEDSAAATVFGANNWIPSNATPGPLSGTVQTTSPGFRNLLAMDFRLTNGSPCIGGAGAGVFGLPGREYFQNEITNREWRIRPSARDIGAFESTTTSNPVGPFSPVPLPQLGVSRSVSNLVLSWPLFAQDFQLEQSDFNPPASWNPAPEVYFTNATGIYSTSSIATRLFFRLRK
jgi:hypothetical protein